MVMFAGMPLVNKRSLETVAENTPSESGNSDDTHSISSAASSSLADLELGSRAQDCCDPSAILYDTLTPLNSSANNQSIGHGLDFIAP